MEKIYYDFDLKNVATKVAYVNANDTNHSLYSDADFTALVDMNEAESAFLAGKLTIKLYNSAYNRWESYKPVHSYRSSDNDMCVFMCMIANNGSLGFVLCAAVDPSITDDTETEDNTDNQDVI